MESGKTPIKYTLIYDKELSSTVETEILSDYSGLAESRYEYEDDLISRENITGPLLLFLSDKQLKELLPQTAKKGIPIALLPHPESRQSCAGLGTEFSLKNALNRLKTVQESIKTDLVYCNGTLFMNKIIVGDAFRITSTDRESGRGFLKRISNLVKRFFTMKPFRVNIKIRDEKVIKTAVTGIVIPEHRKSSLISKIVLENTEINDGKFHTFLISPRSILELIRFGITSYWRKGLLPPFAAHLKTTKLTIEFPREKRQVDIDGQMTELDRLELVVGEEPLEIYPGRYIDIPEAGTNTDVVKVHSLPSEEVASIISQKSIPFIKRASTEEFKELFKVLRHNAHLKSTYLVLMVLSTIIATFGLFANSTPVVIGAMILAPLMSPIISLSMGTLRQDKSLIYNSLITISAGLFISLLFGILITWLTPLQTAGSEIMSRTRPNLLDLGIAVFSGVAGAYAHAREEVAKTLAGVAIAVALIPPLAVSAIGIGWMDWSIFSGAALLLLTNLAGMVFAAAATFLILGFSPLKLATRGIIISSVIVLGLSIPLALGFNQMLFEHNIVKKIESIELTDITIRDVAVQRVEPVNISFKLVSTKEINSNDIDKIKSIIENELDASVEIEVITVYKN